MAKMIRRRDFLKGTAAGMLSIAAAGVLGPGAVTAVAEEGGKYTPGTYTGTAQGLESEVTVTMTFDETSITDVVIDVSGETQGIGADIGDTMKEAILSAQSAQVDAVSGASITSNAVKTAAADCIAQAQGAAPAAAAGGRFPCDALRLYAVRFPRLPGACHAIPAPLVRCRRSPGKCGQSPRRLV